MFENSEKQFEELLANLIVRSNKSLEQDQFPVFGLLLTDEGKIDVSIGIVEDGNLSDIINHVQQGMIEKKKTIPILAACLAYPDFHNQCVVSYLENYESYQLRCDIPVLSDNGLRLDVDNLTTHDGSTIVFGDNNIT